MKNDVADKSSILNIEMMLLSCQNKVLVHSILYLVVIVTAPVHVIVLLEISFAQN